MSKINISVDCVLFGYDSDLDFVRLGKILDDRCPNASFIPEIWQGHKNGGEGFWEALGRLEQYFE